MAYKFLIFIDIYTYTYPYKSMHMHRRWKSVIYSSVLLGKEIFTTLRENISQQSVVNTGVPKIYCRKQS